MSYALPRYTGLRSLIFPLFAGFLCLYFCFHLLYGPRSIFAYWTLQEQMTQTQAQYDLLQQQRTALQLQVQPMRPNHMTKALLEERVRVVLGYQAPDEILVIER
ncbi:MAG: septum formation initiator family protein [Alphaproteobacteria bacterium]|nr:septum formation initiator family protein [Alphaproteobacteria bacterium]